MLGKPRSVGLLAGVGLAVAFTFGAAQSGKVQSHVPAMTAVYHPTADGKVHAQPVRWYGYGYGYGYRPYWGGRYYSYYRPYWYRPYVYRPYYPRVYSYYYPYAYPYYSYYPGYYSGVSVSVGYRGYGYYYW